jgi:hypothetical protein
MEGNIKMDFRDIDCEYSDSWNCQKIMYSCGPWYNCFKEIGFLE